MAEHADTAIVEVSTDAADRSVIDPDGATADISQASRRAMSRNAVAAALGIALIVALAAVAGWLGFQRQHLARQQAADAKVLTAARSAAVNLTSIDVATIDADVQRILDSSTGTFRDQFVERSQPFTDVVRQAQSKTEGTVSAAGIESRDGPTSKVLVAVSVRTTNAGQGEQEPRSWRMRVSIVEGPAGPKVSDVQFVP